MKHELGGKIPVAVQMGPMRYAQAYLWGTFGLFLVGNLSREVDNFLLLTVFVSFFYGMFYFGYRMGAGTARQKIYLEAQQGERRSAQWIALLGAIYFFVYSINMLHDFGVTGISSLVSSILNPGASYQAKFEVFEYRQSVGLVSRVSQLLVMFSIIYALLVPVLVCYWKNIPKWIRVLSIGGIVLYVLSFLAIGTMKGFGDVVLFLLAGFAVLLATGQASLTNRRRRILQFGGALLILAGAVYMGGSQVSRAEQFGITESRVVGDISETVAAKVFGRNFAFGLYSVLAYPSHGYLGLSYNLGQDFAFSHGAGLSPAFESYRKQYMGGEDHFYDTYPARTEASTGWPAGMYWATVFPWVASDLTFVGAGFFMFVAGFLFCRAWIKAVSRKGILSLAIVGQFFVFVAFVPANNQILMQRQGLWIVAAILVIPVVRTLLRVRAR